VSGTTTNFNAVNEKISFTPQLDFPRVMCRGDCPEVAVVESVADVFKPAYG
jgi:hypothetical protein